MVGEIGARFEILKRYMDGVKVLGYELRDLSKINYTFSATKEQVDKMALNKLIINCKAQLYDGVIQLKGIKCKLTELPSVNAQGEPIAKAKSKKEPQPFRLICKVTNGKATIKYGVEYMTSTGLTRRLLTKEETISLISKNAVINARVQNCNGKALIRGVNCDLDKLPVIKDTNN